MDIREEILEKEELLSKGHFGCQGCGAALGLRMALKVLGKKTVMVLPASCSSVIAAPYPMSSIKIPLLHTAFETAASAASGVSTALSAKGVDDINVLAWAGDGGTFDIGLQSLSGAAERNEDFIYICYDNEAYMNTGIQRSSATPCRAWTTTTPKEHPKEKQKKNIMEIMAAHAVPYAATANIAFPGDYAAKIEKAMGMKGTRFIHLLSSCPPGWKISSEFSIKVARLATLSRVFPLYEVFDGNRYKLSSDPDPIPVSEYLTCQGRFEHLEETDIKMIQERVERRWDELLHRLMMQGGVENH
jgi:pyruvate ferredoxin oxidoreductase beta subunit/2-oxoisovalerate ferredoxin oxidoreductase beta subunit